MRADDDRTGVRGNDSLAEPLDSGAAIDLPAPR